MSALAAFSWMMTVIIIIINKCNRRRQRVFARKSGDRLEYEKEEEEEGKNEGKGKTKEREREKGKNDELTFHRVERVCS